MSTNPFAYNHHNKSNSISFEEEPSFDNIKTSTPHKPFINSNPNSPYSPSKYSANKVRLELELSEEEEDHNNSNSRTRLTRRSLAAFSSSSSPTTPSKQLALQREQQQLLLQQQQQSQQPINSTTSTRPNYSPSTNSRIPLATTTYSTRDSISQQSFTTAPPSTSSSTLVEDKYYDRSLNLKGKGKILDEDSINISTRERRENYYEPAVEEANDIQLVSEEDEAELSSSPQRITTTRRTTEELSDFLDEKVAKHVSLSSPSSSNSKLSISPTIPYSNLSSPQQPPPPAQLRKPSPKPFFRPLPPPPPPPPRSSTYKPSAPLAPGHFPPPPSLASGFTNNQYIASNSTPSATIQVQQAFNKFITGPTGALTLSAERRRKAQSMSEQGYVQRLEREKEREKEQEIATPKVIGRWPDTPRNSLLEEDEGDEGVSQSPSSRKYEPLTKCQESEEIKFEKEREKRRNSLLRIENDLSKVDEDAIVEEVEEELVANGSKTQGYEGDYSDEDEFDEVNAEELQEEQEPEDEFDEEGNDEEEEEEVEDINQRSTVRFAMADDSESDFLNKSIPIPFSPSLSVPHQFLHSPSPLVSPPLPSPPIPTPSPSKRQQRPQSPEAASPFRLSYPKAPSPLPSPPRPVTPPLPPILAPSPSNSPFQTSRYRGSPTNPNTQNNVSRKPVPKLLKEELAPVPNSAPEEIFTSGPGLVPIPATANGNGNGNVRNELDLLDEEERISPRTTPSMSYYSLPNTTLVTSSNRSAAPLLPPPPVSSSATSFTNQFSYSQLPSTSSSTIPPSHSPALSSSSNGGSRYRHSKSTPSGSRTLSNSSSSPPKLPQLNTGDQFNPSSSTGSTIANAVRKSSLWSPFSSRISSPAPIVSPSRPVLAPPPRASILKVVTPPVVKSPVIEKVEIQEVELEQEQFKYEIQEEHVQENFNYEIQEEEEQEVEEVEKEEPGQQEVEEEVEEPVENPVEHEEEDLVKEKSIEQEQDHLLSLASELLVAVKSLSSTSPIASVSNTPNSSPPKSRKSSLYTSPPQPQSRPPLPPLPKSRNNSLNAYHPLHPLNSLGLPSPPQMRSKSIDMTYAPQPSALASSSPTSAIKINGDQYSEEERDSEKEKENSISATLLRSKKESDRKRFESEMKMKEFELESEKGFHEREELTRELERTEDLGRGIEDRLEEIKRSIEDIGMNVGVKVATVVQESLAIESRKRSNWLLWALVLQLIFLWIMIRLISHRSLSHYSSIYSDPFSSSIFLPLPNPNSILKYNQISAETLALFSIKGGSNHDDNNGISELILDFSLIVLNKVWGGVKDGFEWYTRS